MVLYIAFPVDEADGKYAIFYLATIIVVMLPVIASLGVYSIMTWLKSGKK